MNRSIRPAHRLVALSAAALLTLAACGNGADKPAADSTTAAEQHDDGHDHEGEHTDEGTSAGTEAAAQTPRLAITYDGGIAVLDANTLETEGEFKLDGFNRVNSAGDGRHVAVTTTGGWALLDAGTWSQAHGDHSHYYTSEPTLSDVLVEADTPGHVVVHDGLVAFFDDGTGKTVVVEASDWSEAVEHGHVHAVREYTADKAHHGVAVANSAGELLVTRGDENTRTGAMILDADGKEIAVNDECPAVHGEAAFESTSGEESVVLGCENGALVFHGDQAHKIASPDSYGRIGSVFAADGNDVAVGDYKIDPDQGAALEKIALIDTANDKLEPIDPFGGSGAKYGGKGISRGAEGEILVLGTDGLLRVLDPATGDELRSIQVVEAWEVPDDWQAPRPAVIELAGMAYVTDPATKTIHIVDYEGGKVWKSVEVGKEMNEIVGVTG
ncbi:MAG: hypothetical protein U0P48_13065 [Ancrocorticia sp.]